MSAEETTSPASDRPKASPMDHSTIEKEHVVDRYLLGRLSAEEEERFVEHYMSCQECLDTLGRAEKMQRAIKHQAIEDAEPEKKTAGKLLTFPAGPKASLLALAALLLLVILPSGLMQRQISELRAELDAARKAQNNVVLATLGAERGSGGAPTQIVRLEAEQQWIVFSLELNLLEHEVYRATLRDEDEREIWASLDLLPTPSDTLTLGLHSTALSPGDYNIQVHGLSPDGGESFVSKFSFRAVPAED